MPNPISEKLHNQRHSATHILMQALIRLYPDAVPGVGPALEDGYYHDFASSHKVSETDFPTIEAEMKKIIAEDLPIISESKNINEGIFWLEKKNYRFTKELAEKLKAEGEKEISFYSQGEFTNMCRGGHMPSTGKVGVVKLTKVSGAYWMGDEKNEMLQRVYGVVFDTQKGLDEYLFMLEEAKKRDHRKLGKELDLFVFSDLVGPGLPLYTPRGNTVRNTIIEYSRELRKSIGAQEVHTPQINKAELFKTSGHYEKYKADMFTVKSNYTEEEYFLKPMNCPQHTQIFASTTRSYRDLPIRYSDFAMLYRDEQPGHLSGLTRLRSFAQDDCHSFCRPDQIAEEFILILGAIKNAMTTYHMDYYIRLSLSDPENPGKYLGDQNVWNHAEKLLEDLLVKNNINFEKAIGEAAFYGPKMDLIAKDSIGREWQLSTIQIDFQMPQRFDLGYTDENGSKQWPVMIHSALVGSPDRFMGVLIEHFAGAFPTWLSPVQVALLPVSDGFVQFAKEVEIKLKASNIRCEVDDTAESVGKKVRNSEKKKVPYSLVIGEKEKSSGQLAVRKRGSKDMEMLEIEIFILRLKEEISERT